MSTKPEPAVALATRPVAVAPVLEEAEPEGFLAELLEEARPQSDEERDAIRCLLERFLAEVLSREIIQSDAERQLNTLIAEIDQKLSDQLNEVLHHPAFQKLEATWRGLKYLVDRTNSGPTLKIKVLNVTHGEMVKDLEKAGSTERSILYHTVVESEYGMAGGKPYGMLMGDYEFTHMPEDMFLLQELSRIAAGCHSPFVAAASPRLFGLEHFAQLQGPDKVGGVFEGEAYTRWRSFRDADHSRYVALTMPRVLARLPYGETKRKVEAFNFEEAVDGRDHDKYLWMSAAWAYAARVTNAFDQDGWLARTRGVEGGGKVDDLPTDVFLTEQGLTAVKCPTEVAIPWWREFELSSLGFLPLLHWKDTDYAAFVGTQSCHKPVEYRGPLGAEATANAALAAKLNYILCVSRFSHYLRVMLATWLGRQMPREKVEAALNQWIASYVVEDPTKLLESDRYKYPLQDARVEVTPIPEQPGWFQAVVRLRPHLHLEGVTLSLRLVAKMPPARP
jgi:type VI secretion system protein ImpC